MPASVRGIRRPFVILMVNSHQRKVTDGARAFAPTCSISRLVWSVGVVATAKGSVRIRHAAPFRRNEAAARASAKAWRRAAAPKSRGAMVGVRDRRASPMQTCRWRVGGVLLPGAHPVTGRHRVGPRDAVVANLQPAPNRQRLLRYR